MKLIFQSHEILTPISSDVLKLIEQAGRICYRSEDKITDNSAREFVAKIMKSGHHSVIEHQNISVKFITKRQVSHELVRHRLASYSQSSTRYCNYTKDKFGKELTFIIPEWVKKLQNIFGDLETYATDCNHPQIAKYRSWIDCLMNIENTYIDMILLGASAQEAAGVLPNDLKTEIIVTANLREWRHILKLRTAPAAHPDMVALMLPLLEELKAKIPVIFDDIGG